MEYTPLLSAPLFPDPDESLEMGDADAIRSLTDEDLAGCRLLLYQEAVEAFDGGGAVKLGCAFQPTPGARFIDAVLTLEIKSPEGTRFTAVGPTMRRSEHPVKLTLHAKGTIEASVAGVEAGTGAGVKAEADVYHCDVSGTGHGTRKARWVLIEDPHVQNGLAQTHALAFSVDTAGPLDASLRVAARIGRPGLRGTYEAIRSMIFGPEERTLPVAFDIPAAAPPKGQSRFLRL